MRKLQILLFSAVLSLLALTEMRAQNLQVMYDTDRGCVTSTIEMFRPDKFGSTYFFVDIDNDTRTTGAYWEISRELCFWKESKYSWLSVHIEYNGGMNRETSFNDSWLAGLTYSGHSKDYSITWSLSALYKAIPGTIGLDGGKQVHNFQLTGVWGINFIKGLCSFSGFFDIWREARSWQDTEYIFITEPQFWVNLNKIKGLEDFNLSIGGEVELSSNFVDRGFHVCPAFGAKWTF